MNEILSYIVIAIFVGVMAFIVPLLINVIDKQKLGKIIEWAKIFVECAEKIYGSDRGTEKKKFVVSCLNKMFDFKESDEFKVDAIIESEVSKLK